MRFPSAVILGLVCLATLRSEAAPLTNCLEIAGLPDLAREDLRPVDFVAQVQAHHPAQTEKDLNHVFVSDGQAGIGLHWLTNMPFALGDTLHVRGNVQFYPNVGNLVVPSDLRILSHGTPFAPESVTLRQIQGTRFNCRRVITTGTVVDAFCAEATRRILAVCPETRILIFTSYGTSEGVVRAIQAGATGAIQKDISFSKLTGVIRDVAAGRTVIAPEIRAGVAESQSIPELTERQREILESITRGLTNSDIATQLGITPDAVKGHLTRLFAKLGVSGRSEAIALAFRRQMLKM